ncbi:hypothetical protein MHM98_10140 [Psychrobium sp. MM17-31]|uniref:hypothetical protein n=1 Tax=Psychrobium sp. MM17-31 TaxID=2917758 RepID=UPI001EF54E21|nr:hypothetical protein [Psychrobium sp. MM17-31]MCG7531700.1 hypothetical protein [Psychrobium sp. MM17-31]
MKNNEWSDALGILPAENTTIVKAILLMLDNLPIRCKRILDKIQGIIYTVVAMRLGYTGFNDLCFCIK